MLIVIDNYDSFTYNLVQYLGELAQEFPIAADLRVFRNDKITLDEIAALAPAGIVISPGPGRPADAGISKALIRTYAGTLPILGVCLGHQAIGEVFGGTVTLAPTLMHGKTSEIYHSGVGVFQNLPQPFTATRYHSLVIDRDSCPDLLEITAWTEDGLIMGVRHRHYPTLEGVQFHPESILTTCGKDLLRNFLRRLSSPSL
ncbi:MULTISPECIES: aminodeoxychorismate/anthranilate synthase component II [unclassified Thermosynechococcus]|uniref:anthranilate synthase component II n=1 Tax=unclassified Thermosynechococcus TaxID=2622553 RepID=UPI002873B422|nr:MULTISPECIES: aminodeoxychorismate/anthranilate synthase component II [unclassified Thermosynechococcus]WNC33199.1 aminodeoxychorismate/anthranilate synthase component II [Thermosynechococcus sp. PKX95]WNC35723.1 aminodeoxychorismate/anthranilate synthase component II [Thermosynechococcus sp. PKX91]WNC38247.1 aminodeoxychorismate/anthranilate synthase component II [Thermosynechococcus sp. WL11]WNC40766.1 aminodeoxychorismate/anthranilate synthase component II [Thermosynechococcus sp. WL17]W